MMTRFPFSRRWRALALTLILTISMRAETESAAPVEWIELTVTKVDDSFVLPGTVTAERRAALSARTEGLVAEVLVDAGAQVEAGAPLLRLDSALGKLEVARARAALDAASEQLAENRRRQQETDRLRASNSISLTEAETRAAETRISAARVEELAAQLKRAEEILTRHVVVAPFAGVISSKLTEAGEWVATGTPVLELVSTRALRVDVRVPQQRFARLGTDTPVRIRAVDGTGSTAARMAALVPVGDLAARTFLARVEPTEPDGLRLIPGMAATVEFELLSEETVLAVPRDALVRRPDGTTNLWLARREGDQWSATQRRIEVGRRFASSVEIRGGVQPGDLVVIRGNETLREGQPIVFAGRES